MRHRAPAEPPKPPTSRCAPAAVPCCKAAHATALPLLRQADELARQSGQSGIVDEVARLKKVAAK
ncbi:MAG: hypothetical protein U1E60_09090 [Reyranellaceae bacterium]